MAQPFDRDKLENTGEVLAVAEQVDVDNAGVGVAVGYFSASQNCVLVYTSGRSPLGVQLTWFDPRHKKIMKVNPETWERFRSPRMERTSRLRAETSKRTATTCGYETWRAVPNRG
jgi:hypothetical protein